MFKVKMTVIIFLRASYIDYSIAWNVSSDRETFRLSFHILVCRPENISILLLQSSTTGSAGPGGGARGARPPLFWPKFRFF